MADAVGLVTELDEPPMVDDAVNHGGDHLVVPEHRPPPAELQVRGDYHRLPLVGGGWREGGASSSSGRPAPARSISGTSAPRPAGGPSTLSCWSRRPRTRTTGGASSSCRRGRSARAPGCSRSSAAGAGWNRREFVMKTSENRSEQDVKIIGMSRPTAPVVGRRRAPEPTEDVSSEPLMNVREVVAFLRVSKSMVYKLAE